MGQRELNYHELYRIAKEQLDDIRKMLSLKADCEKEQNEKGSIKIDHTYYRFDKHTKDSLEFFIGLQRIFLKLTINVLTRYESFLLQTFFVIDSLEDFGKYKLVHKSDLDITGNFSQLVLISTKESLIIEREKIGNIYFRELLKILDSAK